MVVILPVPRVLSAKPVELYGDKRFLLCSRDDVRSRKLDRRLFHHQILSSVEFWLPSVTDDLLIIERPRSQGLVDMEPVVTGRPQRVPRYNEEDTSVTTKRELMGWYAYNLAAEVFAVGGVGKCFIYSRKRYSRIS